MQKTKQSDNYAANNRAKGKNRFERRLHQKVSHSTAEYNKLDMNKLFKNGLLDVNILVHGETDDYTVRIIFEGFLDALHSELKRNDNELTLRIVNRALVYCFNNDDIKVRCDCPDSTFRQNYWLTQHGAIAGDPQNDNGKRIANPNDTKGSGCKHVQMVLSNNIWLTKVSSVIYNYINYMKSHYASLYAQIIYPAVYNREYEDEYQLDIDDINNDDRNLTSSEDELDTSNKWAKTKTRFKQGNEYRFRPNENNPNQRSFNFDSLADDSTENEVV